MRFPKRPAAGASTSRPAAKGWSHCTIAGSIQRPRRHHQNISCSAPRKQQPSAAAFLTKTEIRLLTPWSSSASARAIPSRDKRSMSVTNPSRPAPMAAGRSRTCRRSPIRSRSRHTTIFVSAIVRPTSFNHSSLSPHCATARPFSASSAARASRARSSLRAASPWPAPRFSTARDAATATPFLP